MGREDRDRERDLVHRVASAVCSRWGVVLRDLRFPEDDRPPPNHPVDGIAVTTEYPIAFEHTRHQSFARQIELTTWYQPLLQWARELDPPITAPGRFQLLVTVEALAGHPHPDFAGLEAWVRQVASELAAAQPRRGQTDVRIGAPPEVPFEVRLDRFRPVEGVPDGRLTIAQPIGLRDLPAQALEEMIRILERKLPKLAEHRPPHGRTVLILENNDMQLFAPDHTADAIEMAALARQKLRLPDAIVVAHCFSDGASLGWLKDADQWWPDLPDLALAPLDGDSAG